MPNDKTLILIADVTGAGAPAIYRLAMARDATVILDDRRNPCDDFDSTERLLGRSYSRLAMQEWPNVGRFVSRLADAMDGGGLWRPPSTILILTDAERVASLLAAVRAFCEPRAQVELVRDGLDPDRKYGDSQLR